MSAMIAKRADGPPDALTKSQRALKAAERARELAQDPRRRKWAGVKAAPEAKGKASWQAAREWKISPRSVEMALTVLDGCRELVDAVRSGRLSIRAAAMLVKLHPDIQRKVAREVQRGRRVVEIMAEVGATVRRPPRIDAMAMEQQANELRRLIEVHRSAVGDSPAYFAVRARREEFLSALRTWSLQGPQGPPAGTDKDGRPLPPAVMAAFGLKAEIEDTLYDIDSLSSRIDNLSRRPGGEYIRAQEFTDRLKEVRQALGFACANSVCECRGANESCRGCHGRGWVPLGAC